MAEPQRPAAGPVPAGPTGYVIRPPQPGPAAPGTLAAPVPPTTAAVPGTVAEPTVFGAMTQNGAIVGVAIMLGLVIVFLLLRSAVRSHLISNRASIASAGAASWALFTLLFVVGFTVVFGLLGQFWAVLGFIAPLGLLSLILLILFLYLFSAATRITR